MVLQNLYNFTASPKYLHTIYTRSELDNTGLLVFVVCIAKIIYKSYTEFMSSVEVGEGRYKMRTFSELTGLSPTVLRAWERRHGLLKPARPKGGHRLYTEEDLQVIQSVTKLLETGRAIGEIAAAGRPALLGAVPARQPSQDAGTLSAFREQIVQSAQDLDSALLTATLDRAFALFSLDLVLSEILQPAAYEIGRRWASGRLSIAGEHMVSAELTSRIERIRQSVTKASRSAPLVVCGCLPGEQHELGLLILSLRIASAGYRVAYLGRDLPLDELKEAAEQLGARAVCLSAKRAELIVANEPDLLALAQEWGTEIRVHLGGAPDHTDADALREAGVFVWGRSVDPQKLFDRLMPPQR